MAKSKHDLANITISILVDFDKKIAIFDLDLRSSQHYCRAINFFNRVNTCDYFNCMWTH